MDPVDPLMSVRDTCAAVAAKAAHVTIDQHAIKSVAAGIGERELNVITTAGFDSALHFFDGGPLTAQYLLVIDTLNFCFWPESGLEYEHLARGLKERLMEDEHALDSKRLAVMDGPALQALLRRKSPMPLQDERARLLREVGRGLLEGFGGQAAHLVHAAQRSAARLVTLLTAAFPGFRDHGVYRGHQVFLYKRAQIFVGDLWGAFKGGGLGAFDDIDRLTMCAALSRDFGWWFADYRVPVVLRQMGILAYSPDLALKVDTRKEIASGSEQEVEIRACTVVAVEQLRDALVAKYGALAAADGRVCSSEAAKSSNSKSQSGGASGQSVSVASAIAQSVEGAQGREAAAAASEPPANSVADGVTRSIAHASLASADGAGTSAVANGETQSVADGVTRSIERASRQAANGKPIAAGASGRSGSGRLLLPNSVQLDWCLWETGEAQRSGDLQHHRTRTIYY